MRRYLILGAACGFLSWGVSSCSKKEDSSGAESVPPRSAERAEVSEGETVQEGVLGEVRNAHAERNWPRDGEVENEWTERFKEAKTPEERIEIMGLKQSSGPEDLAPLLRLALREPDDAVREEAARMISSFAGVVGGSRRSSGGRAGSDGGVDSVVGSPSEGSGAGDGGGGILDEVADLVVGAAHDPSSEVRSYAMEAAVEFPVEAQLEILGRTIFVEQEDVRRTTVTELGRIHTKDSFETLLTGLGVADPEFREVVNGEIELMVHRSFGSYEEARNWWSENATGYAENMVDLGESR